MKLCRSRSGYTEFIKFYSKIHDDLGIKINWTSLYKEYGLERNDTRVELFLIQIQKLDSDATNETPIYAKRLHEIKTLNHKEIDSDIEMFVKNHKQQDFKSIEPTISGSNKTSEASNKANSDCVVCMVNTRNIVFLPCKHFCICHGCKNSIVESKNLCPMCRTNVEEFLDVYNC